LRNARPTWSLAAEIVEIATQNHVAAPAVVDALQQPFF
jgi:hypothetical protein